MSVVKVDSMNEGNFQSRKLLNPGTYTFEVANDPVVAKAKSSENNVVSVELRCQDDGEFKGQPVYDTITLTPKAEFKLCHLALAAGMQTKEDIKNDGVDLSLLKGSTLSADITIEPGGTNPQTQQQYRDKNRIERYIFDPEE